MPGDDRRKFTVTCDLPQRTGYQVIAAEWDVGDTAASFFNVIDVDFTTDHPVLVQSCYQVAVEIVKLVYKQGMLTQLIIPGMKFIIMVRFIELNGGVKELLQIRLIRGNI